MHSPKVMPDCLVLIVSLERNSQIVQRHFGKGHEDIMWLYALSWCHRRNIVWIEVLQEIDTKSPIHKSREVI